MCDFWRNFKSGCNVIGSCIFLVAVGVFFLYAGNSHAEDAGVTGAGLNTYAVSTQAAASYYQVQGEVDAESFINSILNPLVKKSTGPTSSGSPFGSKTYTTTTKSSPFGSKTYTTGFSPFGSSSGGFFNLSGNWHGYLGLYGKAREYVSASVLQSGSRITITTSSHQAYGKKFSGTISSSGSIRAYDQRTGETWTTHKGPASKNRIDLYDYVLVERYGYRYLDRLYLER